MKYQEWKLIAESIGSGMTLGLSQRNVIGGPIGSRLAEEEYEDDRDDVEAVDGDEEDEEEGDEENQDFPPDDSEEMYDDNEIDHDKMCNSVAQKYMSKSYMNDENDQDNGTPNDMDDSDGDMDFLNDIDPALMGDKDKSSDMDHHDDVDHHDDMDHHDDIDHHDDMDHQGEDDHFDMGHNYEDDFPGETDHIKAEPVGDEDEDAEHNDTMALMNMMASYCGKYMKSEAKEVEGEDPEVVPVKKPKKSKIEKDSKMDKAPVKKGEKKCKACAEKEMKGIKKGGTKCKACAEKEMKNSKKDTPKCGKFCQCESDEFTNSLLKSMGMKKPVTEDALFNVFDPNESENAPGNVGFAPQGRIGSIGGGYTKDDFADIPVLGESYRLPTLKEWQEMRKFRKK